MQIIHKNPDTLINLRALNWEEVHTLVKGLGWPAFRTQQILRWLYQSKVRDIQAMTDLSQADRHTLMSVASVPEPAQPTIHLAKDGTQKLLFRLDDGYQIESVLIPEGERLTLCISTQAGCTLDCQFCLTGKMGLGRNLKAQEIVGQVQAAKDLLCEGRRITSLVFMGMGEPLANFEAVSDAVRRLTNCQWGMGFSPRKITISTAGMASRLRDVASLGVNLAISLNATTNEQRHRLMPTINSLSPLPDLLAACRAYPLPPGRRLTFEYVLLAGVNDSDEDASRFPKLLRNIRCKINLIPFNEFPGSAFRRPNEEAIARFQTRLRQSGFDVFLRKSRGNDVLGACGQLGSVNGVKSVQA